MRRPAQRELPCSLSRVCASCPGAEGTIFASGGEGARTHLKWLYNVSFFYFEAHDDMAIGSEVRTLAALLAHNMTVLAAPDERVHDHIYFGCGNGVTRAICLKTCRDWRSGSRALVGMCETVLDPAAVKSAYRGLRRRIGKASA